MSDHAHPAFVETIRCMLVNPRRNIGRALERTPRSSEAREYLTDALEQIEALEARVHTEENRHVHTCSCGHTHYVHGDET